MRCFQNYRTAQNDMNQWLAGIFLVKRGSRYTCTVFTNSINMTQGCYQYRFCLRLDWGLRWRMACYDIC